jgi:putative PIN family toxin of toxin-antitoxin system
MHEVVLDTNVLVSALRSKRGASYELIRSIDEGLWRPNISVALALEYEDVLKRSDLVVGFSETDIEYFLDYILGQGSLVTGGLRRRPILPDADDERILELAFASESMIVTHNTRHFMAAERFGVEVATPAQFLWTLRRSK